MDGLVSEADVVDAQIGLLNPMGMPYDLIDLVHGSYEQIRINGITHERVTIGPQGQSLRALRKLCT